jgi:hypothetical protein
MRLSSTEKFKIIDNFLPLKEFVPIRDAMIGDNFPWYFQPFVAENTEEDMALPSFYFVHTFYNADYQLQSHFFDLVKPLLNCMSINKLIRMKGNLYPNLNREIINEPHVDFPFDHTGAVFYLNSNNGHTILDDGTTIKSVENRLLVFNSSLPHQSTHCTDQKIRVNINLNYF